MATLLLLLIIGSAGAAANPVSSPIEDLPHADVSITEVERVLTVQLDESGLSGGAFALVSERRVDDRRPGR